MLGSSLLFVARISMPFSAISCGSWGAMSGEFSTDKFAVNQSCWTVHWRCGKIELVPVFDHQEFERVTAVVRSGD